MAGIKTQKSLPWAQYHLIGQNCRVVYNNFKIVCLAQSAGRFGAGYQHSKRPTLGMIPSVWQKVWSQVQESKRKRSVRTGICLHRVQLHLDKCPGAGCKEMKRHTLSILTSSLTPAHMLVENSLHIGMRIARCDR